MKTLIKIIDVKEIAEKTVTVIRKSGEELKLLIYGAVRVCFGSDSQMYDFIIKINVFFQGAYMFFIISFSIYLK